MDKNVLKDLSYGLYIVTAKNNDKLYGCVANSIMQINRDTIAVSLNKENHTTKAILETKKLGINILDKSTRIDIIETFGFKRSEEYNKFNNISYDIEEEIPILKDTCGYITGTVFNTINTETHTIILIKITNLVKVSNEEPMTYRYYQENLKGKTNKKAPTYQEEAITSNKHIFVCKICGHRYETDLDELPDDFKCPLCGVGKEYFEKIQ